MSPNKTGKSLYLSEVDVNNKNIKQLYTHMKRDFPAEERVPCFFLKRAMKKGKVRAVYLKDNSGEEYGYMVYQIEKTLNVIYVMYFAIHPQFRSGGYGSVFLKQMQQKNKSGHIMLEVEDPAAAKDKKDQAVMERRIDFYSKNGFSVLPNSSIQLFGVPMLVMANTPLPINDFKTLFHKLYRNAFHRFLPGSVIKVKQ